MPARRGRFLVIDGADYTGKSTQARLLATSLRRCGRRVLHLREPGSTRVGEAVRAVLLDPRNGRMAMTTETLLYMAARAQLVDEVVRPALARGLDVVCERFLLSTAVYQGIAGGIGTRAVFVLGRFAIGRTRPDLTILLDIDARAAERRHRGRKDRIERRGLAFQSRVRAGFRQLARSTPGVAVVDARGAIEDVATRIRQAVHRRLRPGLPGLNRGARP
jgi:dTMP kinase